jgi:hypothetical protein
MPKVANRLADGADVIRISGRVYPGRPPSKSPNLDDVRRLSLIVESLRFASESCTEPLRRLYKSILEARAHAENALAQARPREPEAASLLDQPKHELEP